MFIGFMLPVRTMIFVDCIGQKVNAIFKILYVEVGAVVIFFTVKYDVLFTKNFWTLFRLNFFKFGKIIFCDYKKNLEFWFRAKFCLRIYLKL